MSAARPCRSDPRADMVRAWHRRIRTPRPDHRRRPGRLHRRDLRRARQPRAGAGRRPAARRPAHDHHRRGELPGLRRRDPGPLADGADGRPRPRMSAPRSSTTSSWRSISRIRAVPLPWRLGRPLPRPIGDHRDRRAGALARPAFRDAAAGRRRLRLRHLRRVLLPRQAGRGGRRRQHRGRGGALPHPPRRARHADPSPRRAAGREDPAASGCSRTQGRAWSGTAWSRRSSAPAQPATVAGVRLRERARPAAKAVSRWTACSSRSATRRTPACSRQGRDGRRGLCPDRARQHADHRVPACSRPATCRTRSSARRSPPPARAAWRRWRRRNAWPPCPRMRYSQRIDAVRPWARYSDRYDSKQRR